MALISLTIDLSKQDNIYFSLIYSLLKMKGIGKSNAQFVSIIADPNRATARNIVVAISS